MQPKVDESSAFRYAVFRYVTDPGRDMSLPVGVALWRADGGDVRLRFIRDDETVRGAASPEARQFIARTSRRVRRWLQAGKLPYTNEGVRAFSDAWWGRLGGLLQFRVRVSRPMAIDCARPADELEPLYEAIVAPEGRRDRRRIDGQLSRALGRVAPRFAANQSVKGYRGREVTVRRVFRAAEKWVIAEAVNLASPQNAERDADALTSRAMRIREGATLRTEFLIGYVSSPGGLNGEYALKAWIEEKLDTTLFDLNRERDRFEEAAVAAVEGHEDQIPLISIPRESE